MRRRVRLLRRPRSATTRCTGAQDVDTTRATYFAGKAAMVIWSSFILDELAGLRDDAAPSCPQCAADPRFLVDNTGIVTALPVRTAREPAQFGEVAVVGGARRRERRPGDAVRRVHDVRRLPDFLGSAPEGKFPDPVGHAGGADAVRRPVADDPGRRRPQGAAGRASTRRRCSTRCRQRRHVPPVGDHAGAGRAGRGDAGRAAGAAGDRRDDLGGDRRGAGGAARPTTP